MSSFQPGILESLTPHSRYLTFHLNANATAQDVTEALRQLAQIPLGSDLVVGIGQVTVQKLGQSIVGLREPSTFGSGGVAIPANPAALWCWLRGDDPGELLHRGRKICAQIAAAFETVQELDAFIYDGGRDLTGYIDGTENPSGDAAVAAAIDERSPVAGSSFVAVQRWVHDLDHFQSLEQGERDHIIGRRQSDNEELHDAPAWAHVKRTAQESFSPEAFVLRRSMPFVDGQAAGLNFVAFGSSFDAFEAQLKRMVGLEDGVHDGLFRFTRPTATSYFWCPPVQPSGALDLRSIQL